MPRNCVASGPLTPEAEENPRKFFSSMFRGALHRTRRVDWIVSGVAVASFEPVTRAKVPEAATSEIERILAEVSLPMSRWVGPSTRPKNLGEQVLKSGFELDESLSVMSMPLTDSALRVDSAAGGQ